MPRLCTHSYVCRCESKANAGNPQPSFKTEAPPKCPRLRENKKVKANASKVPGSGGALLPGCSPLRTETVPSGSQGSNSLPALPGPVGLKLSGRRVTPVSAKKKGGGLSPHPALSPTPRASPKRLPASRTPVPWSSMLPAPPGLTHPAGTALPHPHDRPLPVPACLNSPLSSTHPPTFRTPAWAPAGGPPVPLTESEGSRGNRWRGPPTSGFSCGSAWEEAPDYSSDSEREAAGVKLGVAASLEQRCACLLMRGFLGNVVLARRSGRNQSAAANVNLPSLPSYTCLLTYSFIYY